MTRLTAEQLEITQAEYDALLWVRDALDPTISDHDLPEWIQFDMSNWSTLSPGRQLTSCGTACCIGGSMEMHMAGLTSDLKVGDRPDVGAIVETRSRLQRLTGRSGGSLAFIGLFYVFPDEEEDRTREKAVEAIDRFLAGNTHDPWLAVTPAD